MHEIRLRNPKTSDCLFYLEMQEPFTIAVYWRWGGVGWGEVSGRIGRVFCRIQNRRIRLPWNADFNNFNKTVPKATDLIFAGTVDL